MENLPAKSSQYLENINLERALLIEAETWLKNYQSAQTRKTYKAGINNFIECLQLQSINDFKKVTQLDVIHFRDSMMNNDEKNSTVCHRLTAVRMLFLHLKKRGFVESNPEEEVERPKVDGSIGETPAMTSADVRKLLKQPDTRTLQGARDSAILHLLFYSGSRVSAPSSIKIKDFYEDKGFYVLKWKAKGGKNQILPVHPALNEALQHYLSLSDHKNDAESPLFAPVKLGKNKTGKGLSSRTFLVIWNKYRVQAGLAEQFTPHSARATFATTADENGVPIQDIQQALGHANISTTQSYIQSRKKHGDSAVFRVNY